MALPKIMPRLGLHILTAGYGLNALGSGRTGDRGSAGHVGRQVGLVYFTTLGDCESRHAYAHAFTVTLVLNLALSLLALAFVSPLRKAAAKATA
ncbi:hypothetical protein [Streptomyces sp. NPDC002676]